MALHHVEGSPVRAPAPMTSPSSPRKPRAAARHVKGVPPMRHVVVRDESGQTMAEYGVVLAVITIAVFGALALLSGNIVGAMTRVAGYIT